MPETIRIRVATDERNPDGVIRLNGKEFHSMQFTAYKIPGEKEYYIIDSQLEDIIK